MTLGARPEKGGKEGIDWGVDQVPMIRYKGVFDWQGTYRLARLWIEENLYKFQEARYKHKGDELEINVTGERKLDEIHKEWVHVYFHIWNLRDIEVVEGTKTLKRQTGLLHIELWGSVQRDYSSRFSKGGDFAKNVLWKWYKVIMKKEFDSMYRESLSMRLFDLHTKLKTFLNMSTDSNYYKL